MGQNHPPTLHPQPTENSPAAPLLSRRRVVGTGSWPKVLFQDSAASCISTWVKVATVKVRDTIWKMMEKGAAGEF